MKPRFVAHRIARVFGARSMRLCIALWSAAASAAPFETSGISDWTTPPAPAAEPSFVPPTAVRSTLGNGMALLVVENRQLPLVAMSLIIPGAGTAYDPPAKPGLAALTADLVDEGTLGMSAIDVAEEQARLGAAVTITAGVDAVQVSVDTLAKTFDTTAELLAKILTRPTFDAKDFERVKGDRATAIELRRDRPREVVTNVLLAGLYGLASPYGHPGGGEHGSFRTLSIDDVLAFYRRQWNPAQMTVVVVGDVDAAAVRNKLDAILGSWKAPRGRSATLDSTPLPSVHRLLLVDRPGAAQSDVRVGVIGIDRRDSRFFAFEVLSQILGGSFTSRLNQRLREQLGITYGVHASEVYRRAGGPFAIATSIVTPETARGLAEILRILGGIATQAVPEAELDKAKQNMIRALPASFETNGTTALTFADLALFQLPMDWYTRYAQSVRDVAASAVLATAKVALPPGAMKLSIVGDLAKIRADLDKLGLGEPARFDPYGMPVMSTKQVAKP